MLEDSCSATYAKSLSLNIQDHDNLLFQAKIS